MVTYFKMKYQEWKFKCYFYTAANTFIKRKSEIISNILKLYECIKDTPTSDLRDKLIQEIASLAHDTAQKERKLNSDENN